MVQTASQVSVLPIDVPELEGAPRTCHLYCQFQFDPKNTTLWSAIHRKACKVAVFDEKRDRNGRAVDASVGAYYRTADEEWSLLFRKKLSCSAKVKPHKIVKRWAGIGLRGRKISKDSVQLNSVDAQSAVLEKNVTKQTETATPPRPIMLNVTPIRAALKRIAVLAPYVDTVFGPSNHIDVSHFLAPLRLGFVVDRYQELARDYSDEVDTGHCLLEYAAYKTFNHRALVGLKESRAAVTGGIRKARGMQEKMVHMVMDSVAALLDDDNATRTLTNLYKKLSPYANQAEKENSLEAAPVTASGDTPDPQEVALKVVRFYLRNYFSNLSGSRVRVDQQDPNNNPDSLADMVEQVSRPFFLSVFGVVPGVPASGRMDPRLLFATDDDDLDGDDRMDNRLKSDSKPAQYRVPSSVWEKTSATPATGNTFYDMGNAVFATLQRASDATNSLYCVKQYAVNKVWDRFRVSVRSMLKSING